MVKHVDTESYGLQTSHKCGSMNVDDTSQCRLLLRVRVVGMNIG